MKILFILLALFCVNQLSAYAAMQSDSTDVTRSEVVNLPYRTMDIRQTVGSISVVNPDEVLKYDSRQDVRSAIQNKVTGLSGNNLHGIGDVIFVVDGVVRDINYINIFEVEQITVLKDAASRLLYGADADTGVVLVKTKDGAVGRNDIRFNVEYGLQNAISYPKYLDAASYMETYNRAYLNDGGYEGTLPFSTQLINNTRNKVDPFLYPDVDYYSDVFVKDVVNFSNVYGEASGGTDKVRYYMNLGWKRNEQWYRSAGNNMQDIFTVRGKADFEVTDWMRMNMDAVAVFDILNIPNVNTYNNNGVESDNFWKKTSTYLPNSFPLLIPVDRITNLDELAGLKAISGKYLLGGTSVYQDNMLGDLSLKGKMTQMDRYVQFKTGLDLDLGGITKGLTAKGMLSFEFANKFFQKIDNSYAIYEIGTIDMENNFTVSKIGNDKSTTSQTIDYKNMDFGRKLQAYATLNYDRKFGRFDVSSLLMANMKKYWSKDVAQDVKKLSYGYSVNLMYDDRYIVDASGLYQGSNKLNPDNRWGYSSSYGAAWIISNEGFLKENKIINHLKLRADYGVLLNDNWNSGNYDGYFLYDANYTNSYSWSYNNGALKNNSLLITSIGNTYTWQKRKELNVGLEASLFDDCLWMEGAYFNSIHEDQMTEMNHSTPLTMGNVAVFENYNSTLYEGFEIGARFSKRWNDLSLQAGVNYMYTTSEILKYEEQEYDKDTNKHLTRVGKYANAMFGYEALGLYSESDFDEDGNLVEGLPANTFGTVRPGDIKYLDYNKDGSITEDDQHILGRNGNNHLITLNINLGYKGWSLYVQAYGGFGGKGFMNSNYYWFKGNTAKYSEYALLAYDPSNPDENARYPRLTLTNGNNNYRNSTFWTYDKSQIKLSTLQIAYDFKMKSKSPVKAIQTYLRGSNLLMIAKDRQVLELNVGSAPQNRVFALGLVATF